MFAKELIASAANLLNDEFEKDAARYRFLRNFLDPEDYYAKFPRWTVAVESGGMGQVLRGDKLDAAIDAAIAKEE